MRCTVAARIANPSLPPASHQTTAPHSINRHHVTIAITQQRRQPENFLLTDKSEAAVVKATDFGLSVFFREGQEEFSDIVGSAYYVAPEVTDEAGVG